MNLNYLIQLLNNRAAALTTAKDQAFMAGDIDRVNSIDSDLNEVLTTRAQLNLLLELQQTASATNSTTADVVASAVQSAQTPDVQGPSASAVINGYDISAYATDPLYEQKIQNILNGLPLLTTADDLDAYIQSVDPGAPVTGAMVLASALQYGIDIPLLVAIMQNDSQFGTLGVGAYTFNPGNVGNTGYATQTYASWADGVSAVAAWLVNHRVNPLPPPVEEVTPPQPATLVSPPTEPTPQPPPDTPTTTPATMIPDLPLPGDIATSTEATTTDTGGFNGAATSTNSQTDDTATSTSH